MIEFEGIKLEIFNEGFDGVPIFLASGFLTENQSDWADYISKHIKAPVYFVKWNSLSIDFLRKIDAKHIGVGFNAIRFLPLPMMPLLLGGAAISSGTAMYMFLKASSNADKSGASLAKFINENHAKRKFIFMGHSLGARLMSEAICRLKNKNIITSISIAGAIDENAYEKNLKKCKYKSIIPHVNIYSDNDAVLKYGYKFSSLSLNSDPIGLVKKNIPGVISFNSRIGHTGYHDAEEFSNLIIKYYERTVRLYDKWENERFNIDFDERKLEIYFKYG